MTSDQPKLTAEEAREIVKALRAGDAIVCYAKCWPCQFGQCSDEPHTWMDPDDREHAGIPATTTAAELAAQKPCGCHCMADHHARLAAGTEEG
jgi:hypothetical protein